MLNTFYEESQIYDGPLVLTHAMPQAQSVAIGVFIDIGARDETEAEAGITHALEHMLFKGTAKMDVHQLAERLDELGGNANAFTSRERTCFHLHVLHEHWRDALEILTGMVNEAALPDAEWQREREVIYAEMAMVDDIPEEWITDQHVSALFPDHAIGKPVLGNHDSLAAISSEQLSDYLQRWYNPPGLMIVAAGRIEHAELVDALAGMPWAAGNNRVQRAVPGSIKTGIQALPREMEQAQMVASAPGIHVSSTERPVSWLANQMLGGGMSSRLFREVREKRGLSYSVGSHMNSLSDTGIWSITCGAETSRAAECVDVIADILAGFADGIGEDELLRAKRQLEVQFRMGLDSVEGQMLYLGARLDEERLVSPVDWVKQIHATDIDAVRSWAADRLSQGLLWSIGAPEQALPEICDRIRA
ncbi:M16 family metallopeptidase [Mariprofundus micogutta]|nr:pitrilysin family protein [Mariprofundus micogutta]